MDNAHYIIHRVTLDLEAPDAAAARRIQDEAVRIFYHWILPKLEELLDRLVPKDVVFRLDSLDLDLEQLEMASFEQNFGDALLRDFEEKIEQIVASSPNYQAEKTSAPCTAMVEGERGFSTFLFFLATGRLPWWSEQHPDALQEDVLTALTQETVYLRDDAARQLATLLGTDDTALDRLSLQFSPAFLHHIILLLLRSSGLTGTDQLRSLINNCLERLDSREQDFLFSNVAVNQEFLKRIIRLLAGSAASSTHLNSEQLRHQLGEILQELQNYAREGAEHPPEIVQLQSSPATPADNRQDDAEQPPLQKEEKENGICVAHAGLVLLHPFLEYYFRDFNLLNEHEFRDASARTQAIHLLHYLAAGEESPPEYLLTFEKFLCGADLLTPVPRFLPLSEPMQEESEKLLQAAIGHWQALKRTSPAGLREGFLQRPGKLLLSSFQNRLVIESKAHDVLLNYLPWGYGIIKLPWLKQPLFVDWVA